MKNRVSEFAMTGIAPGTLVPIILVGGLGTRFRKTVPGYKLPKQFLSLSGDKTLLQNTVTRALTLTEVPPVIVGHRDDREVVEAQLQDMGDVGFRQVLESVRLNTAPAIMFATLSPLIEGDPILFIMPSDHGIEHLSAFHSSVTRAVKAADSGCLTLLGIPPSEPSDQFGYLEVNDRDQESTCHPVSRFIEKPDRETAARFLETNRFFWNSGMLLVRRSVLIDAMYHHQPALAEACQHAVDSGRIEDNGGTFSIGESELVGQPSISIDKALLELAGGVHMVPLDAGWADLGVSPPDSTTSANKE